MNSLYQRLRLRDFRLVSAFFCLCGDFLAAKYIWDRFTNKKLFNMIFNQFMQIQGMDPMPGLQKEIFKLLINSLILMLGFIILIHIFVYVFYIYNKKFAFHYIKILSWFGSFGALFVGIKLLSSNFLWGALIVIQGLLYFYSAYGLKRFPIPVDQK